MSLLRSLETVLPEFRIAASAHDKRGPLTSEPRRPFDGGPELPTPWSGKTGFESTLHRHALRALVEDVVDTHAQIELAVEVIIQRDRVACIPAHFSPDGARSDPAVTIGVNCHIIVVNGVPVVGGQGCAVPVHEPVEAHVALELGHGRYDTGV